MIYAQRGILFNKKKVMIEARASLICVDSLLLWHLEAPLSTSEPCLPVSSFCLQDNNNSECILLAQTATNLSARNESEGSPCPNLHSPDTLPGWAQTQHLITFPLQSQTEAHCVPKRFSSQGARVCLASRSIQDKEPWLWPTFSTLPGWAAASRSTF